MWRQCVYRQQQTSVRASLPSRARSARLEPESVLRAAATGTGTPGPAGGVDLPLALGSSDTASKQQLSESI